MGLGLGTGGWCLVTVLGSGATRQGSSLSQPFPAGTMVVVVVAVGWAAYYILVHGIVVAVGDK